MLAVTLNGWSLFAALLLGVAVVVFLIGAWLRESVVHSLISGGLALVAAALLAELFK